MPLVVEPTPERPPKSVKQHVRDEMAADLTAFPEEARVVVKKYLDGAGLTPEEEAALQRERENWWQDKYGFPWADKVARAEVIRRKYSPPKEQAEARMFQEAMMSAFQRGDKQGIEALKKEYEERYPDQLEGVAVLFEMVPFLERRAKLAEERSSRQDRLKMLEESTQDQFLFSHFILSNSGDKSFLKDFWAVAEKLSADGGHTREFNRFRRGLLSQVAVYKIMEALGTKPSLSHPKEDAFHAIDLWTEKAGAVQIKGHYEGEPQLIPTETGVFPGVEVKEGEQVKFFNSYLAHEFEKFKYKISEYGEMTGRDIKGFIIQIPYSKFDFVTGEPSPEVIEFVRAQMAGRPPESAE